MQERGLSKKKQLADQLGKRERDNSMALEGHANKF